MPIYADVLCNTDATVDAILRIPFLRYDGILRLYAIKGPGGPRLDTPIAVSEDMEDGEFVACFSDDGTLVFTGYGREGQICYLRGH